MPHIDINKALSGMKLATWHDLETAYQARFGVEITGTKGNGEWRCACPLHGSDTQSSLSVRVDGVWQCFTCNRRGHMDNLPLEFPGGGVWHGSRGGHSEEEVPWRFESVNVKDNPSAVAYLNYRGFRVDILGLLGRTAVATRGMAPGDGPRLEIARHIDPNHNAQVGWAGRALENAQEPRWRFSSGAWGFVSPRIPDGAPVVVVEGAFDALALILLQALPQHVDTHNLLPPERCWPIALCGTNPGDARAISAFANGRRVFVALDADEAGYAYTPRVCMAWKAAGATSVEVVKTLRLAEWEYTDYADMWADFASEYLPRCGLRMGTAPWPVMIA